MRTNLAVPFAEKDAAKKLGARWDASRKTWYVEGLENLAAFSKWLPGQAPVSTGTSGKSSRRLTPSQPQAAASSGEIRISAGYFPLSCDCLPWEGCDKCRSAVTAAQWGRRG
ncbi:MAG: DUF5710 domain-containing protein [Rhodocyclaceae bacterium]|nr:DUF5710 domain-containing protein [Rhodocyclaceae bacterium]